MKRKQMVVAMVFAWAGVFIASSIAATVPGLVLHYKFDETADYDVMDSSGNGYTGTVSSSSGWAPTGGQLGGALTVGGHRKAYPPMGCISNLTAVTVSAWIRGGTDGSSFFFACAATNESGATKIVDMAATPTGFTMTAGYNGNSYSSRSVTGTNGTDVNVWEHWSMSFEKDADNADKGVIIAYKNGMAIGTNSNVEADRVVSGIQFSQIGRNNGSTFKGLIDDFRIYDRALNAAELATVMTGDTGLPAPGYETWLAGYTLGAFTNQLDDAENGGIGDGFNNLMEYALGGDPSVDDAASIMPVSAVDGAMLNYIYTRQNPQDTNLAYIVLDGTDLVNGGLVNTNMSETVSGVIVDGFETVTNQVLTAVEGQQFMQLNIELSN